MVLNMDTRSANGIGPSYSQILDNISNYGTLNENTYKNKAFWSLFGITKITWSKASDKSGFYSTNINYNINSWYNILSSSSAIYYSGTQFSFRLKGTTNNSSVLNIGLNYGYGIDILSTAWSAKSGWNSTTMTRCNVLYSYSSVRDCGNSEDNLIQFWTR
jgi:hypothetical protein